MHAEGLRVVLIGGPSNVGKTTLARALADRLGWDLQTTDTLGRHPGRPWGRVRPHVADHYLTLSVDELLSAYRNHYDRMWPLLRRLIRHHASDLTVERLILEGSGVRPEAIESLGLEGVGAIWLTADDDVLRRRIHEASSYEDAAAPQRAMIDKFLARTLADRNETMAAVDRLGLQSVEVRSTTSVGELVDAGLAAMRLG